MFIKKKKCQWFAFWDLGHSTCEVFLPTSDPTEVGEVLERLLGGHDGKLLCHIATSLMATSKNNSAVKDEESPLHSSHHFISY